MATIYQPPRLQLGDAPLYGYAGSEKDQFALVWQTTGSLSTDNFIVEYRPLGSTTWLSAPSSSTINTGVSTRINHTVTVTGVDYNTDYEYRVSHLQGSNLVATYQENFTTRLSVGDTSGFTFAAYGDSAGPGREANFLMVQNRINLTNPDFVLLLGDNAYSNGTHDEYDYRFVPSLAPDAVDWQADHIDFSAFGNHDSYTENGRPYRESYEFPIPVAGVDSPSAPSGVLPELNYSFDYGNVHFATFDSNTLNSASALDNVLSYIETDLAASNAQWKIVYAHHPVAGAPDKGENPGDNYYRQLVPRLIAAGADLFLAGHSHTYSWTYPLTGYSGNNATFVQDNDKVYDKGDGLVQAVIGTGGTGLRTGVFNYPFVASGYSLSTSRQSEHGFANVSVTGNSLTVDYVAGDNGEIIDSFQIVDNGGTQPPNPEPTTSFTFQNGVNGYLGTVDTYLQAAVGNANNSNASFLNVDSADSGGEVHGLIRFDNLFGTGAGQIDLNADIQSAFLELNVINPGDSMQFHNMLTSWTDTDSWNSLVNGIQANNIEADSTVIASTGAVSTGILSVDVTASLQAWQNNPSANYGWVLLPTGTNGVDFDSAQGINTPRLVVDVANGTGGGSNQTPVAVADSYAVDENSSLTVNATNGVLANDSDADGDTLTAIAVSTAANGSLTLNSNGGFTYTPNVGFSGVDSFNYQANDGTVNSPSTQVDITVNPASSTPQSLTFQNGVNGYLGTVDTYLQEAVANANNSNASFLNVDSVDSGGEVHGLIRFDNLFGTGAGQIGLNAEIQSAFLELNVINPGDSMQFHNMLTSWTDTDSWNSLVNGIQANNIEADSTVIASTGAVSTGTLTVDVTASLQAWQNNPSANYGWALLPTGNNGVDFDSAQGINTPRLVVDIA